MLHSVMISGRFGTLAPALGMAKFGARERTCSEMLPAFARRADRSDAVVTWPLRAVKGYCEHVKHMGQRSSESPAARRQPTEAIALFLMGQKKGALGTTVGHW
jgi:hypothetical protein